MAEPLYPVFMKIRGARCLVVGGGEVAARKVDGLIKSGAKVRVVSIDLVESLEALVDSGAVEWHRRLFQPRDTAGCGVVIAATSDPEVNRAVAAECRRYGIPVNVADQPELCTFYLPAVIDRFPVQIAVSSGGESPLLARFVRAELERQVPTGLGRLARFMGTLRKELKTRLPSPDVRRRFFESVLESNLYLESPLAPPNVEEWLKGQKPQGEVYLVGAGPGDPELLTLKALRLMQKAEVVIHDRLVSDDILNLVRREAQRIYVGKQHTCHTVEQEEINRLMIKHASSGKRVLRLKGGDPFIFGRGGEEVEALTKAGISVHIVPGITAALGCAASAAIPLTHRQLAHSVQFLNGHPADCASAESVSSPCAFDAKQTLVVYMGLTSLPHLKKKLLNGGMPPSVPAALIQSGTRRTEKIVIATVDTMADVAERSGLSSPVLVIIGEVVRLREMTANQMMQQMMQQL